jgi:hypothetical protein
MLQFSAALGAEPAKVNQKNIHLIVLAYPHQPLAVAINLLDQGQILVTIFQAMSFITIARTSLRT